MKFQASSQYELMWQVAQVINPEDFPQGVLSYFTFEERDGFFHMQRIEKSYTDEMLFMQEVSGKIAGRIVYGALSFLNGELNLYFRGFDEMGVMVYSAKKWILQDYEHFQIREDSPVYQRFEISNAWNELKKSIA